MRTSPQGLSPRALAFAATILACLASLAGTARADDCPLGSTEKNESGFTWCEPSVCESDTQCATGLVCRPVSLCVEVGALDAGARGDAGGPRLMARQRCGAAKECPQITTCSEKSRCLTPAQAEKAGLLPGSAPGTNPPADAAKKSACGCSAPGTAGSELAGGALALLGAIAIGARRRARPSP